MSGERIALSVSTAPVAEHVSYVAGAITEILAAGAEHRTSEAVMHTALNVLRDAAASQPVTITNPTVSLGDEATTNFGAVMNGKPPAKR